MNKDIELTLDQFFQTIKTDLEHQIHQSINDEQIIDILQSGKRLRPLLQQLCFKACTKGEEPAKQYQKSIEGSVAIELAHAASLVHDDIIDDDMMRRGRKAFHIKQGVPKALLVGHRMLSIGFNIALSHGEHIAELYVNTWNEVLNGELEEVEYNATENDIEPINEMSSKSKIFKEYFKIINLKTASLFSSACKAGGLQADATEEILDLLARFGREIGLSYQLADDLVDLEKGEMIDSVIIPLLTRLEHKKVNSNSLKVKTIQRKLSDNAEEIKALYLNEIQRHLNQAQELSNSDLIPESAYKTLLQQAPLFVINRMLSEINITL